MIPLKHTEASKNYLKKVRINHDAIIDVIIANPTITQKAIADYFGYNRVHINKIFCSKEFHARLSDRRAEVVDYGIMSTFEERLKSLADQSLDILAERLEELDEDGKSAASDSLVVKALEISSRSLGYGARQSNVAIQNNLTINNMSDEKLMEIAGG